MESGALLPRSEPSVSSKPDVRGGWRAALFLIAAGFAERGGFIGVQGNLIMYLTGPLGLSTAATAAGANSWNGTVLMLPLLGAVAADSCIGRYRAVVAAGVLYLLSFGMLTVSSMLPPPHPQPAACLDAPAVCSPPPTSPGRVAFFYAAIYLVALAQGFYKPCAQAFGADQFQKSDRNERASRSSFFNWFNFSISCGYTISVVGLSYVQDNVSWPVGFGASWVMMLVSLSVFLLGTRTYRTEQPVNWKPFARLAKTFVSTARTWMARVFPPRDGTDAASLLTPDGQEEGTGVLVKLLPIWMTSVVYAVVIAQVSTLFTKQGSTMDRRLGTGTGLVVPPAALQSFVTLAIIASVPVYDRVLVPLARRVTKHPSGITMLQRIGAGMAMSCLAMVVAALVEAKRLRAASDAGLLDRPDATVPMSLWWIIPQYVLIGLTCVFTVIGLEEFFYDQMPDALRSVGLGLYLSIIGVGNYTSGVLVWVIDWATRGRGESWFSDNLNRAHLDYFYWLLAGRTLSIRGCCVLVFCEWICLGSCYFYVA